MITPCTRSTSTGHSALLAISARHYLKGLSYGLTGYWMTMPPRPRSLSTPCCCSCPFWPLPRSPCCCFSAIGSTGPYRNSPRRSTNWEPRAWNTRCAYPAPKKWPQWAASWTGYGKGYTRQTNRKNSFSAIYPMNSKRPWQACGRVRTCLLRRLRATCHNSSRRSSTSSGKTP